MGTDIFRFLEIYFKSCSVSPITSVLWKSSVEVPASRIRTGTCTCTCTHVSWIQSHLSYLSPPPWYQLPFCERKQAGKKKAWSCNSSESCTSFSNYAAKNCLCKLFVLLPFDSGRVVLVNASFFCTEMIWVMGLTWVVHVTDTQSF